MRLCHLMLVATMGLTVAHAAQAADCLPPIGVGQMVTVAKGPAGKVRVVAQTVTDNPMHSGLSQVVTLDNSTEASGADIKEVLMKLYIRAKQTCRKYPLKGAMIFAYGPGDTWSDSPTLWMGRLDADNNTTKIEVQKSVLSATSNATASCQPDKRTGYIQLKC